jgi:hypothetical protein
MRPVKIGTHQLLLKIQPDPPVLPAVKGTAGRWPVLIDPAAHGFPIHVDAVTVVTLVNQIGLPKIPVNDPLPDVLPGEGEWHPAAGPAAKVEPARAIDAHLLAEGVLVILAVLEHYVHAPPLELLRHFPAQVAIQDRCARLMFLFHSTHGRLLAATRHRVQNPPLEVLYMEVWFAKPGFMKSACTEVTPLFLLVPDPVLTCKPTEQTVATN